MENLQNAAKPEQCDWSIDFGDLGDSLVGLGLEYDHMLDHFEAIQVSAAAAAAASSCEAILFQFNSGCIAQMRAHTKLLLCSVG